MEHEKDAAVPDRKLLLLLSSLPLDLAGKVLLTLIDVSDDEPRLWAAGSRLCTVYSWFMTKYNAVGVRRRSSGHWPLIRALLALFSLPHFRGHYHGRGDVRSLLPFAQQPAVPWCAAAPPCGAVRTVWDSRKHGGVVFGHLCEAPSRDVAAHDNMAVAAAARCGFTTALVFLLGLPEERNVDPGADGNKALRCAATHGHADIVELLVALPPERNVDPGADESRALRNAAQRGRVDVVKVLLGLPPERGVDPAAKNDAALRRAAQNGHAGVVELLLERNVNPGADDNQALRWAAWNGQAAVVKLLLALPLEHGVDPAVNANEPLRYAAGYGHTAVVKLLLDLPAQRNVSVAADDYFSFRAAAENGFIAILKLLLALPSERAVPRNVIEDVLADGNPSTEAADLLKAHLL